MKNITLALDEKIIKAGREYARKHNLTLNSLIRRLLEQTVTRNSGKWVDECYLLMDKAEMPGGTKKWKREDLYRV
jgi:hypothetical protein